MRRILAMLLLAGCGSEPAIADGGPAIDSALPSDAALDASIDAGTSPWRTEPAIPETIQEISGAVHRGQLWIAGGFDGSTTIVRTVRIHDPATSTWSLGPDLPFPRHHAMLVSDGTDLFLFGGMQTATFDPLDTAFVLRDGATAWTPIATMPENRAAGVAGLIGDRIVIAAGDTSRGGLATSTMIYEPAMDRWTMGAAIPRPREHTAGFVSGGELWIVAGRSNSLTTNSPFVDVYDLASDTWREGPPIPTARGGHGVALLDGFAYAIGGEQPDRALDSVERLDVAAGTWSAIDPVPTPRHGHVVLAAAGRIWVIGGANRPIFAAVDVLESFAP